MSNGLAEGSRTLPLSMLEKWSLVSICKGTDCHEHCQDDSKRNENIMFTMQSKYGKQTVRLPVSHLPPATSGVVP